MNITVLNDSGLEHTTLTVSDETIDCYKYPDVSTYAKSNPALLNTLDDSTGFGYPVPSKVNSFKTRAMYGFMKGITPCGDRSNVNMVAKAEGFMQSVSTMLVCLDQCVASVWSVQNDKDDVIILKSKSLNLMLIATCNMSFGYMYISVFEGGKLDHHD